MVNIGLREKGRRAVGQWPPDDAFDALIARLDARILSTADDDARSRLKRFPRRAAGSQPRGRRGGSRRRNTPGPIARLPRHLARADDPQTAGHLPDALDLSLADSSPLIGPVAHSQPL